MTASLDNSILLIDKGEGYTSFETVRKIRRLAGAKKAGHSGTLDKFASGLLVVCTGQATKLARFFLEDTKRYLGTIKLGVSTDTDDVTGQALEPASAVTVSESDIAGILRRFSGEISQRPPRFSALKIKGRRASDMARKGDEVELEERRVSIYGLEMVAFDFETQSLSLDVTCSKGTYIRSLARDMGEALGVGGHLAALRRIRSGGFLLDDAVTLQQLEAYVQGEDPGKKFISPPGEALRDYTHCTVKNTARHKILNGAVFSPDEVINMSHGEKKTCIIFDEDQNFIAIADIDIEKWRISYLNTFQGGMWLENQKTAEL